MGIFVTTTLLTSSLAFKATPFAWAAFVLLAAEAFRGAVPSLADAIVTAATTDDHQYGRCRLWGAIAWGSVSVVSGLLIEDLGFKTMFAIFAATALSGANAISRIVAPRSGFICKFHRWAVRARDPNIC